MKSARFPSSIGAMIAFVVCIGAGGLSLGATFHGLGDLPGGTTHSEALGISADGSVVVGWSYSEMGQEAFRWTLSGGMVPMGALGGGSFFSAASAVSADGKVVVGASESALGLQAFRWTSSQGMVGLGDLKPGSFDSYASGVSGDGAVVVGTGESASGYEPFRWTEEGGMVGLGALGGPFRAVVGATAVSSDGSTVVGTFGGEAFRWRQGTGMVPIGHLPGGNFCQASAVSSDGSVVVGVDSTDYGPFAFIDMEGSGMMQLPFCFATGVSGDGRVVVGVSNPTMQSGQDRACIWTGGAALDLRYVLTTEYGLDLSGWVLTQASAVSADGRTIVGYGTNPSGNWEAWVATIPEPGTLALLALGASAFVRRRARRNGSAPGWQDSSPIAERKAANRTGAANGYAAQARG